MTGWTLIHADKRRLFLFESAKISVFLRPKTDPGKESHIGYSFNLGSGVETYAAFLLKSQIRVD